MTMELLFNLLLRYYSKIYGSEHKTVQLKVWCLNPGRRVKKGRGMVQIYPNEEGIGERHHNDIIMYQYAEVSTESGAGHRTESNNVLDSENNQP